MAEYLDWALGQLSIDAAVIADHQGLPVVARQTTAVDAAVGGGIELLLDHVSDVFTDDSGVRAGTIPSIDGYLALQYGGRHFTAVWTPTDYGRFYGVLIGGSSPTAEALALAGRSFRAVFTDKSP